MPNSHHNSLILAITFGFAVIVFSRENLATELLNESDKYAESLLAVDLNGISSQDITRLITLSNGRMFASEPDMHRWGFKVAANESTLFNGEDYLALDSIEGLIYTIDQPTQTLILNTGPQALSTTHINAQNIDYLPPSDSPLGGFLNYDLQYENRDNLNLANGLLELGIFNSFGVGTTDFLGQSLDEADRYTRLNTTFTHDSPEKLQTFRLGDSVTRAGAWGRSVRFGGLQWATNFGTQPQFIPFPLPTVKGEAAVPSTVDLFTDNALRLSRDVQAGPFEITNPPILTGAGELQLVVRDLLGREQIVTRPYYISQELLSSGLVDDSFELGFVRRNFGFESNEYGRAFAAGTRRWGLTDTFTGEGRAEILQDQQTLGLATTSLFLPLGTLSTSIAGSNKSDSLGGLFSLGIDHQSRRFNFGIRTELTTRDFTQLGLQRNQLAPLQTTLAQFGFPIRGNDFVSLSYINQNNRQQTDVQFASASYGFNLWRGSYLTIFAFKDLDSKSNDSLGLTLSIPLGSRTTASTGYTLQNDNNEAALQVQRNLPEGSGLGYRLLTVNNNQTLTQAALFARSDVGTYSAEVARFEGDNAYRLNASGAVAILDKRAYLARRVDDSFGVVRVGDYPNVQVYADNQPIAHTDSSGYAFIPRLRSYDDNSISFEQADLPLDAQVQSLKLNARPAFRSGVRVDFPVQRSNGALLTIVVSDGTPLPPGSVVTVEGGSKSFPIALHGEAYVTGLKSHNRLQASWQGQHCIIEVNWPKGDDPLPDLGTFVCEGIHL